MDADPLAERDRDASDGAVRRLEVLAERASEVFTTEVAGHILGLVREQRATELLGLLRRLGSRMEMYRADVLGLALEILGTSHWWRRPAAWSTFATACRQSSSTSVWSRPW